MNAIDLMIDADGVDQLIEALTRLKMDRSKSHYHVELGEKSPFGHEPVYGEIILQWVGEPDLFGEAGK